jgi:hypothetical protein
MPEGVQYQPPPEMRRRDVLGLLGGGAAAAATGTALARIPPKDNDNDQDEQTYADVATLKKQFQDFASAKDAEGREMLDARHYYHGDQWTAEEIRTLRDRKQPVVTSNRIVRKIDAVVGLVERLRQDPKAFPRTPKHDQGAEVATAVLRFVLDNNDWASKSSRIARAGAIDGISGLEYDLVTADTGDPTLQMHITYGDGFFYDPRSYDEGFTDCRFMGVAKWCDADQVKEIVPGRDEEIENLAETASDTMTVGEQDREKNWVNTTAKKIRLVDHWYIWEGKWCWCLYAGNLMLMQGVSPFVDEQGKTFPRYRMFSAYVDHDGDRYGPIRNLKSPQDEINHRRSKSLHLLNSRKVISEKGAVDDIERSRREWAKADGWVEINPGLKMEPDQSTQNDFKGQLELLQEAKNEIENFGPNPALIGQGLEDSSGRAIQLLQQAGIAELGPYLTAYKNWKLRVYRDIWNIVQRHWTAERWIRVTDDMNVAQFFKINKLQLDQYGRPQIVNAVGELDVDIIIDEAPDTVNMQGDSMMVLQSLGPQFLQQFPEIAIELSPLPASVKKPMMDKIQAQQNKPPPPDPRMAAVQAKAALDQQTATADAQRDAATAQHEAMMRQQEADRDAQNQMRQQQLDAQARQAEASHKAMLDRMTAQNEAMIERIRAASDIAIAHIRAQADMKIAADAHEQQMAHAEETLATGVS